MASNIPQTPNHSHLTIETETIELDEPDLEKAEREREDRTRATMKAVDSHLAKKVLPAAPGSLSPEEVAATRIQSTYRGYQGRKEYIQRLYQKYEQEEVMRLEKTMDQVAEGELLVENHRLEVQLEENSTTRRNKSRQYTAHVITIQRAWRAYKSGHHQRSNYNMSPLQRDNRDADEAMSLSTPDSERILRESCGYEDEEEDSSSAAWEEDEDEDEDSGHVTQSSTSTHTPASTHPQHVFIEPEPESCVSDYSEMADPIKEHLANVEIVQQEALDNVEHQFEDTGKTGEQAKEQAVEFVVRGKIQREPEETEEEFNKRLKKINFLSLAQEFAELKKIDADALPFDLHKSTGGEKQEIRSPMSEETMSTSENSETSESSSGRLSALATPCESEDPFGRGDFPEEEVALNALRAPPPPPPPARPNSVRRPSDSNDNVLLDSVVAKMAATTIDELPTPPPPPMPKGNKDKGGSSSSGESAARNKMDTSVEGDFDVYNIETTLPQMDWALLEQQLKKAAEEEEKQKKSRRTDREEIRRKLAMGGDEDYYGGERAYKKPNLQTRLQHGMNLQICFMNPDTPAATAPNPEAATDATAATQPPPTTEIIGQGNKARPAQKTEEIEDEDFFAKQQRLQAEATMALAQVRPMAHMQLEIEKQNRKKSPIAEIIQTAIPGFSDGRKKKLAPRALHDMNVAQLQVVVNDLHTQIESLNEELVLMLVERDDLHMQQDSMLVNSEDLLARAQEFSLKVQPPQKKKKEKKK